MYPTILIKITRLHDDVKLPRRATVNSIGADLYAYLKTESGRDNKLVIPPNQTRMISTGVIACAQPPFSLLVCSRSGLATKGLYVTNSPGVIDPDYRGEIKVLLHNGGVENQWIHHGDRVAQLVLAPIPIPEVSESAIDLRLLETARGEAGFGSTGA